MFCSCFHFYVLFLFVHLLDFNTAPCFVVVVFIVCSRFPFWVSTLCQFRTLKTSHRVGENVGDWWETHAVERKREKKAVCPFFVVLIVLSFNDFFDSIVWDYIL